LICDDTLNCGHRCNQVCHLMVQAHSEIKCQEPCERFCLAVLHPCKLTCFVECGDNCQEIVDKELNCGHNSLVKCATDPSIVKCAAEVEKTFPGCMHIAVVQCCNDDCPAWCDYQVPCGHSCTRQCHFTNDPDHLEFTCLKPCTKLMKNCTGAHACQKSCHEECDLCRSKVIRKA
jgi:hypothetical protein